MTPVMKDQELPPDTGDSQSEDSGSENGCCTMETCKVNFSQDPEVIVYI